jgi:hypothetical protein
MRTAWTTLAALTLTFVAAPAARAGVHWSIGLRLGVPACGPCYGPGWGYYRPYPVYLAPAPVYVQPAVVQAVPVTQPVYAAPAAPAAAPAHAVPVPAPATFRGARPGEEDAAWADLASADERARAEAALRLGRRKEGRAVEPLLRALREDHSPAVREAAARALGLIGAPASLAALQNAAQADDDRDVRRSASFAADVIRTNLGGPGR